MVATELTTINSEGSSNLLSHLFFICEELAAFIELESGEVGI